LKIYFLASKGISFTSKIIRWWQFGFPYTHIAIPININNKSNPIVIEMWWNGIRKGRFFDVHTKGTNFAVYSVNVDKNTYLRFHKELDYAFNKNYKYDWLGILGFPFRSTKLQSKRRFFCSELAFYVAKEAGIELLINTEPAEVSPRLFLKSPLLNFEYYYNGKEVIDA
jgi:hypothetical protein